MVYLQDVNCGFSK